MAAEAFLLRRGGLWYPHAPKDVVIWYLAVGVGLMAHAVVSGENGLFAKALRDAVGLTAIMEFVVNFYVFPLLVELLLVPLLTFVLVLQVVAETQDGLEPAKPVFNGAAATIGILLISYAVWRVAGDFRSLATAETLDELILPVALTVAYFPLMYSVARYSQYDRRRRFREWQVGD